MRCLVSRLALAAGLIGVLIAPAILHGQGARGGWTEPAGGWVYSYEGDLNACDIAAGGAGPPCELRLDGSWGSLPGSDAWEGSGLGADAGAPGGMQIETVVGAGDGGGDATVLRVVDPGDPRDNGFPEPSNRKLYSGRDLADLGVDPDISAFTDGLTLLFRFRQLAESELDPFDIADNDADGTGYEPFSTRKAVVGIVSRALGVNINLGFTLRNGRLVVNTVDPPLEIPLCDTAEFVSVWATAVDLQDGTFQLTLYLNGSLFPVFDGPVTLGADAENLSSGLASHYLYLGLGATGQFGAFDVDYLCFLPNLADPAGGPGAAVQCPPGINCTAREDQGDSIVEIGWFNFDSYDSHEVIRDNVVIATLQGSETAYTDLSPPVGQHTYELNSKKGAVSCRGTCPGLSCTVEVTGQPIQCITDVSCALDDEGMFHIVTWTNNDAYTALDLNIYLEKGEVIEAGGVPCQDAGLAVLFSGPLAPDSTLLNTAVFGENQLAPGGIVVMELIAHKGDEVCDPVSIQCIRESRCPVNLACEIVGTDLVATWTAGAGLTELSIEIAGQPPVLLDDPTTGTATLDISGLEGELTVTLTPTACIGDCAPLQCVVGGHQDPTFHRGDSNSDGTHNISDPVNTLNVLFLGLGNIPCQDAADSNDDGAVNISDPVNSLNVLFLGTGDVPPPLPPEAGQPCGADPTADAPADLGCATYTQC